MIDGTAPLSEVRHIHFIGIGGIGMSGLAELCLQQGKRVSGSDQARSERTDHLVASGADIHLGHDAAHVGGADLVVYSAAVSRTNPELQNARDRGILAVTRADLLGALARVRRTIAVAGTHGKTTTTAMIGMVLIAAGLDPTIVVGGVLPAIGSNVRVGQSSWMVVEADEFDRSFHTLAPSFGVITSIDADHLEYYGSQAAIDEAFLTFAHLAPCDHPLVVCADDPGIQRIAPEVRRRQVRYGFSKNADVRGDDVVLSGLSGAATVCVYGQRCGDLRLTRPGRHHLQNALGALAAAHILDIPVPDAMAALAGFTGVKRRFEIKGEVGGIQVIDDYAHHPNEIRATLNGLAGLVDRRVIAVFQPHLYTRTRDFASDFGCALAEAPVHRIVVTDVYASREAPIAGVTGKCIVDAARKAGGAQVEYMADKHQVAGRLMDELEPGDIVLTMGAGDVDRIGDAVLAALKDRA